LWIGLGGFGGCSNLALAALVYLPLRKRITDTTFNYSPVMLLSSGKPILFRYGDKKEISMSLSAPTMVVFIISLVIAVLGLLAALGVLSVIPLASVWIMAIAYVVLAAGCLFKGV
jgi:hypothetical protein